jgi:hypothetical protein
MKKPVTEKTLNIEGVTSVINMRRSINRGLAVFAYDDDPEARNVFIDALCDQITSESGRIGVLDTSVRFSEKTIYDRLFPKGDRGPMSDYVRKDVIEKLRDITLIKNAQDLIINTKKEQHIDMALIRKLTSTDYCKIFIFIGPKSIISLMEVDSDVAALSLSGRIEN